ncbi:hypothetical protein FQA39_LY11063 [Lamprigera yunnana]|nr:hypothetical protein FQA39_LY11063 [Lamprigera yunnana]
MERIITIRAQTSVQNECKEEAEEESELLSVRNQCSVWIRRVCIFFLTLLFLVGLVTAIYLLIVEGYQIDIRNAEIVINSVSKQVHYAKNGSLPQLGYWHRSINFFGVLALCAPEPTLSYNAEEEE